MTAGFSRSRAPTGAGSQKQSRTSWAAPAKAGAYNRRLQRHLFADTFLDRLTIGKIRSNEIFERHSQRFEDGCFALVIRCGLTPGHQFRYGCVEMLARDGAFLDG